MPGPNHKNATLSAKLLEPVYRLFPRIGIDAPDLAKAMVDAGIDGHAATIFENGDFREIGAKRTVEGV